MQQRLCGREQEFGMKILPAFENIAGTAAYQAHPDYAESGYGHPGYQPPFDRWRRSFADSMIRAIAVLMRGNCFQDGKGAERVWLSNGALAYVDNHIMFEIANAEYLVGSLDGLAQEKATELIASEAAEAVLLQRKLTIFELYKNNTGPKPNEKKDFFDEATYGNHQNYSYLSAKHEQVLRLFANFLPVSLLVSGSGHVFRSRFGDFVVLLSQRANHIVDLQDAGTTSNRPLINLRGQPTNLGEPLMDDSCGLTRFHLISRDATRCEFQTWLVDMITHLVLRLAEEGCQLPATWKLRDPVKELRRINFLFLNVGDVLDYQVECGTMFRSFGRIGLFDYNYFFLEQAKQLSPLSEAEKKGLQEWERILELLKARAFDQLVGELDWATKKWFLEQSMARKGFGLDAVPAWRIDMEYHNISPNPQKSLFAWLDERGYIKHLVTPEAIERAKFVAPATRARSRGRFIKWCARHPELAEKVRGLSWDGFNYSDPAVKIYFGEKNDPFAVRSSTIAKLLCGLKN